MPNPNELARTSIGMTLTDLQTGDQTRHEFEPNTYAIGTRAALEHELLQICDRASVEEGEMGVVHIYVPRLLTAQEKAQIEQVAPVFAILKYHETIDVDGIDIGDGKLLKEGR